MKRISTVLALLVAAIALLSISCGTSDSLKSLTLSAAGATSGGTYNLNGVDGTLQLQVTANYNSGKLIDVTNASTYTVTTLGADQDGFALPAFGPTSVTISPTGMMTTIEDICTWTDIYVQSSPTSPPAPAVPPVWALLGYYQVTATYRNFTSQPVGIGVGSATSKDSPDGGCGPS